MGLTLTTPALLFSTLSLLLLAYTNRFLTLATLTRSLCEKARKNDKQAIRQMNNLKKRIIIIKYMQFLGIFSLLLCVVCMFFIFIEKEFIGKITFGGSLFFMMGSLILSMMEINISVDALNIELETCEYRGEK